LFFSGTNRTLQLQNVIRTPLAVSVVAALYFISLQLIVFDLHQEKIRMLYEHSALGIAVVFLRGHP
jgi:hypothetical protein